MCKASAHCIVSLALSPSFFYLSVTFRILIIVFETHLNTDIKIAQKQL